VIDGQEIAPLSDSHRLTVRRAPVSFMLVKVPGRSYYQTLRDKLRWGTPRHTGLNREEGETSFMLYLENCARVGHPLFDRNWHCPRGLDTIWNGGDK
jgi:hypothetical protein